MKKVFSFILFFLFAFICFAKGAKEVSGKNREITVYAYDSFCSSWGPGTRLIEKFTQQSGIKVNLVSLDGAVNVYTKLVFEGENSPADLLIGLSDTMKIDSSLFEYWVPECSDSLIDYDQSSNLVPFSYGTYSFIADTQNTEIPVPHCLEDLTQKVYKNKIIIADPRTSSVGLGLLLWTVSALGEEKAFKWWENVKDNILTVCSSWSTAYGLFTENEAPLVISYTTSPVYHLMFETSERYRALEFSDGHINTIEYLGIPKTSEHKEDVKKFCNFLLTEGQNSIAVANTMFPANIKTELPSEFSIALKPSKILEKPNLSKTDYYLDRWTQIMSAK